MEIKIPLDDLNVSSWKEWFKTKFYHESRREQWLRPRGTSETPVWLPVILSICVVGLVGGAILVTFWRLPVWLVWAWFVIFKLIPWGSNLLSRLDPDG